MSDTTIIPGPPDTIPDPPVVANVITFADFEKVELHAGTIIGSNPIPKSTKLLKLEVSFGEFGNRVILAGVGESFNPENMLGRQVVAVLNLAPRKMMGIESHGMLLAGQRADGSLSLVQLSAPVPDGTRIG
jgi:methionyl-tRNA synthetase